MKTGAFICSFFYLMITACSQPAVKWHIVLGHDKDGSVISGSAKDLISTIRQGCEIRVAWGAHRAVDPSRTIEHKATPIWIAVRDGKTVEVQLDDFLINLNVLGKPTTDHPRREKFGGTQEAILWRANLKTDGSFHAVWYKAGSGDFVTSIPQRHPMRWFADCKPTPSTPLYGK